MISLKRSLPNANHRAYRRLSGLVGFRRPLEFGLDRPRLSPGAACLGPAYGLPSAWPVGNTAGISGNLSKEQVIGA